MINVTGSDSNKVLTWEYDGATYIADGTSGNGRVTEEHILEGNDEIAVSIFSNTPVIASGPIRSFSIDLSGVSALGGTYRIWDYTDGSYNAWGTFSIGGNGTLDLSGLDTSSPTISHSNSFTILNPTTSLPEKFLVVWEDGANFDFILLSSNNNCLPENTLITKIINDNEEKVFIKDLKIGDIIKTNNGNLPLSKIMKSIVVGEYKYVKFAKGCFGDNLPSDDLYITKPHPISLGYVNNSELNDGILDDTQDDKVFIHISAENFIDKIEGITLEVVNTKQQYNLIFDKHSSVNICDIEVLSHHPSGYDNQIKLLDNEYHDKNVVKKHNKPFFITYETLISYKPENMELKTFLGKCITSNKDDKFIFENLNQNKNILREQNEKLYS